MGTQEYRSRDAGADAVSIRHAPDGGTTPCHALSVAQAATSGQGSAINVTSDNASSPAVAVKGAGDLIDLRDASGTSKFKVSQSGGVTAGGAALGGAAFLNVGTTTGTIAAGDDSRFSASKPWVFDVTATAYGAAGDGKVVTDGAMSSSSNTTRLTCATSTPFTSADVGKVILVKGAAATGVTTLVATISAYTSSSVVTLSVAAATTVSGALVMWGTDDTSALQSAINAAVTYAQAHGGAATVYVPIPTGRFYAIGGTLVSGGTTKGNAQLTLPIVLTTANKVALTIEGASDGSSVQHWEQTVPQTGGSCLVSFKVHASSSAQTSSINAAGNSCVIGGPSQPGGYGISPGVFSNMNLIVRNLSILTTHSANGLTMTAMDLTGLANAGIENFAYGTAATVAGNDYASPGGFANGLAPGLILPASGNNDNVILRNVTCHGGYTYGIFATEHADIYGLRILYCWAGFCPVGTYYSSVGSTHAIVATLVSVEACTYVVYVIGAGSGGLGPFLHLRIDTETGTPRFGDNNSGTASAAARGDVILTGLYTAGNLTLDYPVGYDIADGQKSYPARAVSGDTTATAFDELITVDATGAGRTVTLPTATGRCRRLVVIKVDSSGNTVTLDGAGSETINGATTKVLSAQWAAAELLPVGGNWVAL
jgi:hypothetical protein